VESENPHPSPLPQGEGTSTESWITINYEYNAKQELLSSQVWTWEVTNYLYDSNSKRVEKVTWDSVNRYVYKVYEIENSTNNERIELIFCWM
jgi:hypothetical protein